MRIIQFSNVRLNFLKDLKKFQGNLSLRLYNKAWKNVVNAN